MRTHLFIIFTLIFAVCGCRKSETIPVWFSNNEAALLELNRSLLNHPQIRRVDPEMSFGAVANSESFDADTKQAYLAAEKFCERFGIVCIAVSRVGEEPSGKLVAVDYILSRSGIVTSSGSLLAIVFIPDPLTLEKLKRAETVFTALPTPFWYVESSHWK